ncbi:MULTISPECIES: primosomal replication protein N [Bordetella]|uniref:Replication restart protein PriB n=2 Tax=Bordetella TaxID=517 RepID=A0A261VQ72_9BORD|nr:MULTISPECIES: primosomal replication protein N [Bordetella]MDM9561879.1 primosomal replication protein N [Bordetella petrii]OZI76266.1 primosomal replication protein N [Bordetella genomosp. 2]
MNKLELSARVLECEPLRHTPAGVPALEMLLAHESEVVEAGHPRRVEVTISAVALGDLAQLLAGTPLGTELQVQGFLAAARKDSVKVKLHMQLARKVGGSAGHDPLVG